jgi:ubiquinol-cytochrome c reductase cytochrome c1 subunit
VDLTNRASLQRGAGLYMNYCSGCHSLNYHRYSRMGEDLGLTEDEVMKNLNFTGAKFGEQINVSLTAADATKWFGKMPPELSLMSRVRVETMPAVTVPPRLTGLRIAISH